MYSCPGDCNEMVNESWLTFTKAEKYSYLSIGLWIAMFQEVATEISESNIIHRVSHSQLYGDFTENTIQINHES